ncbi:uncharacterized protein L3040_008637 [Drepanopeziza brunnea f. sp. 'multigermtubi']|nr:hypothetical protein L3040_008637 [Drepanopeziza brunnea f. sp. 'multigermtubi']
MNATIARTPPNNPLIVVLGATGTGKSQLAVDLATRFSGEIINADAVQMYDGLPIITNRITSKEQQGIPHHLLGFIALKEEPWRVSLFKQKAGEIIKEIRSRGRLPIVVGGTHYYTQSLLFTDALVEAAQSDEEQVQPELTNQEISEKYPVLEGPTEDMINLLKEVDPVMAEKWHPKDRRKIRRSLEIFLVTGKKASDIYTAQQQRKALAKATSDHDPASDTLIDRKSTLLFWVHAESEVLKTRLDSRVDKMLKAGLLEEVGSMDLFLRGQAEAGVKVDRTRGIWVSIGYKEFEPYLDALHSGKATPKELNKLFELSVKQTKTATRHYAKQQLRWIRLKFIPALSEDGSLARLYLLDGSDVAQFSDTVTQPAIKVTETFLGGGKPTSPLELCAAAAQFLGPDRDKVEPTDVHIRQECETCRVVTVTDLQWQTHLQSRRHRALVKKKQKNDAHSRHFDRKTGSIAGSNAS